MSYRSERGFDRVRRPDALPVFRRKIVEVHQLFVILEKALCNFRVFRFVRLDERAEGLLRTGSCLSLPDVV